MLGGSSDEYLAMLVKLAVDSADVVWSDAEGDAWPRTRRRPTTRNRGPTRQRLSQPSGTTRNERVQGELTRICTAYMSGNYAGKPWD